MTRRKATAFRQSLLGYAVQFWLFPQEGDHQVKIESSTKQSAVPPYSSAMLLMLYAVAMLPGILLGCDDSAVPQRRRCGV